MQAVVLCLQAQSFYILLRGGVFRVVLFGNVAEGNYGVRRQGKTHPSYLIHQIKANALTLFIKGRIRVQIGRLPQNDFVQIGCHIHWYKGYGVAGFLQVEFGNINKAVLKIADHIIVGHGVLRKDNDRCALSQPLGGNFEGGKHP